MPAVSGASFTQSGERLELSSKAPASPNASTAQSGYGPGGGPGSLRGPKQTLLTRYGWLIGIVIVLLVASVATAIYVARQPASTASGSVILISAPSYEWLPPDQPFASSFTTTTNVSLSGTFSNSNGLVVYAMTPGQYLDLVRTDTVSGYVWTSGTIPGLIHYDLSVQLGPGSWSLVFYNPNATNPSGVDFWSSITETPS